MKLDDMTGDQLEELEKRLASTAKRGLDKYKRWEAEQKLKLVRAELKRRSNPLSALTRGIRKLFEN